MDNNNNNDNNNTEYRIIYKPKKNQTVACSYCKSKKIKCSGTQPCSSCTKKGFICEYVEQKKRGKKKKLLLFDGPLTDIEKLKSAQSLWSQSERIASAEKFCSIRWWWKNVLNLQGIKSTANLAYHGQLLLINAWLARLDKDFSKANELYMQGNMIAKHGVQGADSMAVTALFILLSDFAPSCQDYNLQVWTGASHIIPVNPVARRTKFYGMTLKILYEHGATMEERSELLVQLGAEARDLWDAACFMSVKLCLGIRKIMYALRKIKNEPITLSTLEISKKDSGPLTVDALLCEGLFTSQIHLFGFEWTTCTQFTKLFLFWGSGEREKSVTEATKIIAEVQINGPNSLCLVDVKILVLPLMILNEVGITHYNKPIVDLVESICRGTDQMLMLQVLGPLLDDLRNDNQNNVSKNSDIITFMLDVPFGISDSLYPLYPSSISSLYSLSSLSSSISPSSSSSSLSSSLSLSSLSPLSSPENVLENDLSLYFSDPVSLSSSSELLGDWNV